MLQESVKVIGVPLDLGADRRGVDMGPDAMRNDGLVAALEALGLNVEDCGDLDMPPRPQKPSGSAKLKYFPQVVEACLRLKEWVTSVLNDHCFPVVIGGDHSIAIGTTAGLSQTFKQIGMIWIDAHGDFNTEETTITGNIHGMSFATAVGLGSPPLVDCMGVKTHVRAENCVLIGARDFDPLERVNLRNSAVKTFTMRDIDSRGMHSVMGEALAIAGDGTDALHVSFDLDSIDPNDVPEGRVSDQGRRSTAVRPRSIMEMIADSQNLRSLEVVELNPILDRHNMTGKLAIGLIQSALGKRIL